MNELLARHGDMPILGWAAVALITGVSLSLMLVVRHFTRKRDAH